MTKLSSEVRVAYQLRPDSVFLEHRRRVGDNKVYLFPKHIIPLTGKDKEPLTPDETTNSFSLGANKSFRFHFGSISPRGESLEDKAFIEVNPTLFEYGMVSFNSVIGSGGVSPVLVNFTTLRAMELNADDWLIRISV